MLSFGVDGKELSKFSIKSNIRTAEVQKVDDNLCSLKYCWKWDPTSQSIIMKNPQGQIQSFKPSSEVIVVAQLGQGQPGQPGGNGNSGQGGAGGTGGGSVSGSGGAAGSGSGSGGAGGSGSGGAAGGAAGSGSGEGGAGGSASNPIAQPITGIESQPGLPGMNGTNSTLASSGQKIVASFLASFLYLFQ